MRNLWRLKLRTLSVCFTDFYEVKTAATNSIYLWNVNRRFSHFNMDSSLEPPSVVRGMKILEKEKFIKVITVPCLYLPSKTIQGASKRLKNYLLKLQNFRPITPISQSLIDKLNENNILCVENSKMAILDPGKVKTFTDVIENDRLILEEIGITQDYFAYIDITLNYDNWRVDEILRAVIPTEFDAVSGYSLIGHIVHLNLREHLTEYKDLIGAVILDKVKAAQTVVNKVDIIDSTYRNFKMEILCGVDNMITQVYENKYSYKFDFSKVYWNPRLSSEHERISELVKKGDVFYDVCAGVGPFAIPIAKKGCTVLANDLNPDSAKWLQENIALNKVKGNIKVYNKDGNQFIKEEVKCHLLTLEPGDYSIHIIMNLPALATTFLPSFKNLFSENEMQRIKLLPIPKLYVYTFAKGEDKHSQIAINAVEEALGQKIDNDLVDVFFVRNVAPNKQMMRVTLFLTENIISNQKRSINHSEREVKKICV